MFFLFHHLSTVLRRCRKLTRSLTTSATSVQLHITKNLMCKWMLQDWKW